MFSLKIQGEVTVSSDEFECSFCKTNAEIVYIHNWISELVWEGCTNCLIEKIDGSDLERKKLQKKLDYVLNRKDVDCICPRIDLGCKCGSSTREKFLKKLAQSCRD